MEIWQRFARGNWKPVAYSRDDARVAFYEDGLSISAHAGVQIGGRPVPSFDVRLSAHDITAIVEAAEKYGLLARRAA